jgi:hypothetical protein
VLRYIAVRILKFFDGGDDLEVLARIDDVADGLYDEDDTHGFLDGLNRVIVGTSYKTGFMREGLHYRSNRENDRCMAVGRKCADKANYDSDGNFVDWEAPLWKSTGYRWMYRDDLNQARHFWSAFISTVEHGTFGYWVTTGGNVFHDGVQWAWAYATGESLSGYSGQDLALAQHGANMGLLFGHGFIDRGNLGDIIRITMGANN